jgi:diguanylate cyclase (GGDEF)-like protein
VVADDDKPSRDALVQLLRGAGHVVEAFEDGQEAVDRVAQGGVHLVMLDIVMPRLGGLEACRLLKGMSTDVFLPVVLVTGKTDSASRVEGLKIGADDYVCKPFDEQELLARTGAMLRVKRLSDHLAAERQRLERMGVQDELTGLYNYRYLISRLPQEFKRAERMHEPFACALIDVDRLRAVNDTFGRPGGDAAIKGVADILRRATRDVDVLARYGGEEFLVILPGTHLAGAVATGDRLWQAVQEQSIEVDTNKRVKLTVSVGISLYPSRDVRTKEALLRAADTALAQAKREGGNRICVFQQQGYVFTPVAGARSPGPQTEPMSSHGSSSRVEAVRDPFGRKPT